jgi:hypothetical protein
MTDQKIAEMVGMSPGGLALAIRTPEYKEIEAGIFEGRLTQIDYDLAEQDEEIKKHARAAVPAALRALVDGVTQRRDLRSALLAAKTILQFDPSHTLSDSPLRGGAGGSGGTGGLGGAEGAPQLPENVIAYLSLQGNKVVAEIRTPSSATTSAQTTASDNSLVDSKRVEVGITAQEPAQPLVDAQDQRVAQDSFQPAEQFQETSAKHPLVVMPEGEC